MILSLQIDKRSIGDNVKDIEVVKADFHCPSCGSLRGVYCEIGEGDYYDGVNYYCDECKSKFVIPWVEHNVKFYITITP